MFKPGKLFGWCVGAAFALGAVVSSADTLELKNGDIINGVYMGGTQNTVRFSVDGVIQTIPVSDIIALTFDGTQTSAAPPPPPPPPPAGPALEPVEEYQPAAYAVPAGTPFLVRMLDTVDSRQHKVGHRFSAELEADLSYNGKTVAPAGSRVYGEIADHNQAGRIKGKTWLVLELREIRINDKLYPIVTSDYELRGEKSAGKRTALTTIGGAALGAIVGGKGDRAEGAAVGAGVGLAASAIGKGEQIQVPAGTLVEYRLVQPFSK